jgi:hypothetical protein
MHLRRMEALMRSEASKMNSDEVIRVLIYSIEECRQKLIRTSYLTRLLISKISLDTHGFSGLMVVRRSREAIAFLTLWFV